MIVFPNAKINIGLNIVERREDGFHNLESCFYPVPWLDILEVIESDSFSFSSSGIEIPGASKSNLVVQAYQLLKDKFDLPPVSIHLHKNIPIGAGLGGGSSDAAFMIKLLNDKFGLGLSGQDQEQIAGKLGSDCPFFINNQPVFVEGTGNRFSDIDIDLSELFIVIAYPEIHIGTKEAYGGIDPRPATSNLKEELESGNPSSWSNHIKNDFEDSLFGNHPKIESLKNLFYDAGATYSSMTGSGSAVYGLFEKKPQLTFEFPFLIDQL